MTSPDTASPPRSRTLKVWLIVGTVVATLSVVPAAIMGMMSVMASDSGVTPLINVFIYVMLTFPVAIVVGPLAAWVAFWLRRQRTAWILLFSPFAWVVAIVVLMVRMNGG